ncbi:hypothetical protein NQ317_004530 [Molorchus minor]|uniref:Uncharacterized protein n=1 Tax=Molorchus minor TaxID=1323400 RepID=A0ABQ9JIF0_9CUCU|nr:hypothetical protein NQ317_004530 [Molorchus minor]
MGNLHETLGINELKDKSGNIWKALLAEFLGNFLLNYFGCASVVSFEGDSNQHSFVLIALTFGLTIFIVVQSLQINYGQCLKYDANNCAWTCEWGPYQSSSHSGDAGYGEYFDYQGGLYIVVQCLGALAGSAVLKSLTPEALHENGLGITKIAKTLEPVQGFGMEFFLRVSIQGFVLVLTVCGVCDKNRPDAKPAGPLAIGLAVCLGHLAAIGYTGSSMNPARSFGSAVIAGDWENHWIYWVGPILGGVAAALLYKNAFKPPSLGPLKIIERYTTVATDEKELRRLDGAKGNDLA